MHASKIIEVRDHATYIPALAVLIRGNRNSRAGIMLWGAGYGDVPFVILHHLQTGETRSDPNQWNNKRTMPAIHRFLIEHWDEVPDGGLIDVRVVLGETDTPCESEVL